MVNRMATQHRKSNQSRLTKQTSGIMQKQIGKNEYLELCDEVQGRFHTAVSEEG